MSRRGAALAALVVAAVAVGGFVVVSGADDGEGEESGLRPASTRPVSAAGMERIAARADYPVFWAGVPRGAQPLVTIGSRGVLVSYIQGQGRRAPATAALAIGTFPMADPESSVERLARTRGWPLRGADGRRVADGGNTAYFADPGNEVRVEAYHPRRGLAARLAREGRIRPVE